MYSCSRFSQNRCQSHCKLDSACHWFLVSLFRGLTPSGQVAWILVMLGVMHVVLAFLDSGAKSVCLSASCCAVIWFLFWLFDFYSLVCMRWAWTSTKYLHGELVAIVVPRRWDRAMAAAIWEEKGIHGSIPLAHWLHGAAKFGSLWILELDGQWLESSRSMRW